MVYGEDGCEEDSERESRREEELAGRRNAAWGDSAVEREGRREEELAGRRNAA